MPPTSEEQNYVQNAMLEKKLAKQIRDAELAVQQLEDRAELEHRLLNEGERQLAQKIMNAPVERVIHLESPKLRSFLNHIAPSEWEKFNKLAAKIAHGEHDDEGVNYFVNLYQQFCAEYDKWLEEWVSTLDPETVTALSDALEDKDNPAALETIQRITESLTFRREQEIDPSQE